MESFADCVKACLTPAVCEQIDLEGYAVLDSPLSTQLVTEIGRQVKHCFHDIPGGCTPNAVQLMTTTGSIELVKPHIYECDLHQAAIRSQLPFFTDLFDSELSKLVEVLRSRLPCCEDLIPFETAEEAASSITLKLQMNKGGAFPWHYDNPARPNRRRLTMAVYLTEDWTEEVGGELLLMPFLSAAVTVPPRSNCVAFFRSDMTLHRTLPVKELSGITRYCFTVWFDGMVTNSDDDLFLRASHLHEESVHLLKRSPLQRSVARAVYEAEFRQSIIDCFGEGTEACKLALAEHDLRSRQLLQNPALAQFIQLLQLYRGDCAVTS